MPNNPELEAGVLDRRVTLLKPVLSEYEDEIVDWEPRADVWASVQPASGRELNEAGRVVSTVTTPIVIRYRTDVDARWRVRDRERLYQIRAVSDVARRRVQLQLDCEEVL